jgi:hypothetical protein
VQPEGDPQNPARVEGDDEQQAALLALEHLHQLEKEERDPASHQANDREIAGGGAR